MKTSKTLKWFDYEEVVFRSKCEQDLVRRMRDPKTFEKSKPRGFKKRRKPYR